MCMLLAYGRLSRDHEDLGGHGTADTSATNNCAEYGYTLISAYFMSLFCVIEYVGVGTCVS